MAILMKEMAPIRLGNLEVTRVEEMIWTVSPRFLCRGFPTLRSSRIATGWCPPSRPAAISGVSAFTPSWSARRISPSWWIPASATTATRASPVTCSITRSRLPNRTGLHGYATIRHWPPGPAGSPSNGTSIPTCWCSAPTSLPDRGAHRSGPRTCRVTF